MPELHLKQVLLVHLLKIKKRIEKFIQTGNTISF